MNILFRSLLLFGMTLPMAMHTAHAQAEPPTNPQKAGIIVDAGTRIGAVPRLVFGSNIEAADGYGIFSTNHDYSGAKTGGGIWDPQTGAPLPKVLDEVRNAGVSMLRYPGGCLVHGFNWKDTVGKPADRPNFLFGVDEFIAYCRAAKAEPLMQISDYTGTAADAADLVEYLNAPATPAHPWAQKRALWGHPEPYGVKYFEMGNESDHGNHDLKPTKKFTAEAYAVWFNQYSRLMKAVDPSIQMGALMGTATTPDDPWNAVVLQGVKDSADFIVIHKYAVGLNSPDKPVKESADLLMRASMASSEQFEVLLKGYQEKIHRVTGKDLPLALTEYNALFVQDKPVPYRFSLGAALFSADYVRVMMRPESNVVMANYWQLINGYWGYLRKPSTSDAVVRKEPAYYLFRLWGQHFGTQQVSTTVNSPRLTFEGFAPRVRPASGDKYQAEVVGKTNLLENQKFSANSGAGYTISALDDRTLRASLNEFKGENYVSLASVRGEQGAGYIISFDGRSTGNLQNTNMGLGAMDSRGWNATQSAIALEGVEKASDWKHFESRFATLPDSQGIDILWRLRAGTEPVSGSLEIKNLRVVAYQPETFPAYATITATSSLSADSRKLYVMVFNKHHSDAIDTAIDIRNFPVLRAKRWTVTGPFLESTNATEEVVRETESGVSVPVSNGKTLLYRAPAHSMTAFEFETDGGPIYQTDFNSPDALGSFRAVNPQSTTIVDGYGGTKSLQIERPAAKGIGGERVSIPLSLEDVRGKTLRFEALVRAEDVAKPAAAYNGVKVTFHTTAPSGQQWAQMDNLYGTFDWKTVGSVVSVPPDATDAELIVGLAATTGKVWFDNISVVAVNTEVDASVAPTVAPYRVKSYPKWLAIGDSITAHEPAEALKWLGETRGMAASSLETDYIHRLRKSIQQQNANNASEMKIVGRFGRLSAGTIEQINVDIDEWRSWGADLVTVQLGENEKIQEIGEAEFEKRYRALVDGLLRSPKRPMILCTGVWAPGAALDANAPTRYNAGLNPRIKDDIIQKICHEKGLIFVPIAPYAARTQNFGWGEVSSVQWHPNDLGMKAYADAIFAALASP